MTPAQIKARLTKIEDTKKLLLKLLVATIIGHFIFRTMLDNGWAIGPPIIYEMFDLDREQALGAWISQAMFLLSGLSIYLFTDLPKKIRTALAALFLYFSLDEMASIHERAIDLFQNNGIDGSGFFKFEWLILGVPAAIGILAFAYYVYKNTKGLLPKQFFYGLCVFFAGSVLFEGIGGVLNTNGPSYSILTIGVEETLELAGGFMMFSAVWRIDEIHSLKKFLRKQK